jgi:hypothetical protein
MFDLFLFSNLSGTSSFHFQFLLPRVCAIDGYQFSLNTTSRFLHILSIILLFKGKVFVYFLTIGQLHVAVMSAKQSV